MGRRRSDSAIARKSGAVGDGNCMTTLYDATAKDLFELSPDGWLGVMGQPRPADKVRMIDADLSATVSTATDKVIYVDDPQPWLVMAELQANWDGDLPFDILRRFALLR